jgi:hypothetical protein
VTKTSDRPRHQAQDRRNGKGRYDAALIEAKTKNSKVELCLALETPITDEDGVAEVFVTEVDTYSIKVKLVGGLKKDKEFWVGKAFIIHAAIL